MFDLSRLLTRRRTTYLVLLLCCTVLSLRPVPSVERVLDLFFVPTRAIAELAAPVRWWRGGEVRASEESLWERAARTRAGAAQLLVDEQRAALPVEDHLRLGRRLVHGEVIGRDRDNLDRVAVRVATSEGIETGLPVVTGDWFVGRVVELDPHDAQLLHVELVTASGFRVGARVDATDRFGRAAGRVGMVVGGLSPELAGEVDELYLEVHNPWRRWLRPDPVLVEELDAFEEAHAGLARGFSLGRLRPEALRGGSDLMRIEPGLDFKSGLFQVVVLAPPSDTVEDELELETYLAERWIEVRALTRGDVTATREGRRLSRGRLAGVEPGSAVAFGGHLIGRIGEVGWLTSDLVELGDPGLRLAVLARIAGDPVPRPLGEIVAKGRLRDGRLSFRWTCRVDLPGGAGDRLDAELYTGSGEEGIPRGLFVGKTSLPVGRDVHEITVEQDGEARVLGSLWVWRGASGAEGRR